MIYNQICAVLFAEQARIKNELEVTKMALINIDFTDERLIRYFKLSAQYDYMNTTLMELLHYIDLLEKNCR